MKSICRIITCFLIILMSCRQEANSIKESSSDTLDSNSISEVETPTLQNSRSNSDSVGTYEFVYPDNTSDMIENHYIKLNLTGEPLEGTYYGTSDEFDKAREGYLPGFFVSDLLNLEIEGDSIKFVVLCDEFFTKPIDLRIENSEEARKQGYAKRDIKLMTNVKKFKGAIHGDTIRIEDEFGDRLYLRVD